VIEQVVKRTEAFGDGFGRRDDVAGFLEVLIRRHRGANTTIELLQTGLIQRIVDARQISHLPPKRTPSKLGVLSTDPEGVPPDCTLSYASVLGMIIFTYKPALVLMSASPSPNVLVSQVPLAGVTGLSKGLDVLLHPTTFCSIFTTDVFVDANFAGGWGFEDPNDTPT
jgi:hypothetical protein